MDHSFEITRNSRGSIAQILDNHTLEQLNFIPPGFNNNLIWNIGHIIVVEQMLIYGLSGLPLGIQDSMLAKYRRGTKPEIPATQYEVDQIRSQLHSLPLQTIQDYNQKKFQTYKEFTTMSGFTLRSAEAAIEFNNYHEAIHTGTIMAIRKFV